MKYLLAVLMLFATLAHAGSSGSIYPLNVVITDQNGARSDLGVHRGHPVLVTMFYSSCPMACPLLIDTLRAVERSVPPAQREQLRVLMVSIDPEHDTTDKLKSLAVDRRLDTRRWTLARADASSVRKIAAALGIQYRRLPDGGYNHASIITLLTAEGEIVLQSSVLGSADPELLARLRELR